MCSRAGLLRQLFDELGLTPRIAFSSPSIEMVRGIVKPGFGTRSGHPAAFAMHLQRAEGGVCGHRRKTSPVPGWWPPGRKRGQLTKPAQLFADYCREQLTARPRDRADASEPRSGQQSQFFRPGHGTGATSAPKLAVDVAGAQVCHRVQRDEQLIADFLVRTAPGNQLQHHACSRTLGFRRRVGSRRFSRIANWGSCSISRLW